MTQLRKVYIVDDDQSVRTSLVHLLSMLPDSDIESFASGDLFLAKMADLEPGCLVLDLQMPGASGISVLEALRSTDERFRTVVLTGEGDVGLAVQAMKLGASDFLEKPCSHVRLLDAVELALTQQAEQLASETRRTIAQAKIDSLSQRERDVLVGLINGHSNKLMAHELGISPRTVEIYRAKLMEKMEVRSLSEVLTIAFAAGLYPEG